MTAADPAVADPAVADPATADPVLTIRYFAAAAEASGIEEESVPAPTDLDALLNDALARHGASLARVLPACSVLLDGLTITDRSTSLAGVTTVDLLPPFSGG